ncbi:MAG TPA: class I SAM-dependent methyltransferase [Vicinamibacterales bacterium]
MPTLEENLRLWNEEHSWPGGGDEWSTSWGGAENQWRASIFPRISSFLPASHVLEIAPGHGRWTRFLQAYATKLTLVDFAPNCIDACRSRFRDLAHLEYHVNDGRSLEAIADGSVDFVFSFDSLVHADAATMRSYCGEIARTLRVGGSGFLHHSNLGAYSGWLLAKRGIVSLCRGNSRLGNLLIHDSMRAPDMTAARMARYCREAGLTCTGQEIIPWEDSRRPIDCFTVLTKEETRTEEAPRVVVNRRFMQEAARKLENSGS